MKITKRQLRKIVEGYNSMSDASRSLAARAKRYFHKNYPEVRVGINAMDGWIEVEGRKAVNMSQASGRPLKMEDILDQMKQAYLGHQTQSDLDESEEHPVETMNTAVMGKGMLYKGKKMKTPSQLSYGLDYTGAGMGEALKITKSQLRMIIKESLMAERRMATDVLRIVSRALNTRGPMTHQQLLANVLDEIPNTSDEEIDMHIDNLEDAGQIIYDTSMQKYR